MNSASDTIKALKYYKLAKYNADLFSKDPHKQVGAILLSNDFSRILSTGVNGFVRKMNDDKPGRWERPTKYNYVIHAECNAIANAARTGTPTDNAVAVVTMFPCKDCTKMLLQAGISRLYAPRPDFDDVRWGVEFKISQEILDEVGVKVEYIEE